jgi:hypothetical protein
VQRALLPLIVRHSLIWGEKPKALSAAFLSEILRHSVREVVGALDDLITKNILVMVHEKSPNGVMRLYAPAPLAAQPSFAQRALSSQYSDSNYYINLSNEVMEDLHTYALVACDREGLSHKTFENFNLHHRSKNMSSFDWNAEFEKWLRRELSHNSSMLLPATSEDRPSQEHIEMTHYFIRKLSLIDPQFQEPNSEKSLTAWIRQIQHLDEVQGYSILEIKSGIDWLFSAKGDWFRPNVPDAYHLSKHFKRIISNTRSFRDGETRLPDGVNIFDIIGRE